MQTKSEIAEKTQGKLKQTEQETKTRDFKKRLICQQNLEKLKINNKYRMNDKCQARILQPANIA